MDLKKLKKGEFGEEDVDIGDEMPTSHFPRMEIEKDAARGGHGSSRSSSSSSSGSSSYDSSSSSGVNGILSERGSKFVHYHKAVELPDCRTLNSEVYDVLPHYGSLRASA